jgi:single-strand DNA-binding protein
MPDGLNKVMLIGNLGRDPEMRYTANGKAVTTFSLAVNRSAVVDGERRDETEWFTVTTWERLAEIVSQNLQKGRKVYVEGRITLHSWDGPDNQKRYRLDVVANQVLFLDRPQGAPMGDTPMGGVGDIDPDDLPFDP